MRRLERRWWIGVRLLYLQLSYLPEMPSVSLSGSDSVDVGGARGTAVDAEMDTIYFYYT